MFNLFKVYIQSEYSKLKDISILIFLRKFGKLLYDSFMAFRTNQVPIRAAALTYATLLAFVPFIIILSITASKLGYLQILSGVLPELSLSLGLNVPLDSIQELIEHAQAIKMAQLGFVGSIFLFISFLLAMSNLEKALNIIWGIRKNRNWLVRMRIYIPFLICLVLFILLISWMLVKLKIYLVQFIQGSLDQQLDQNLQFGGILISIMGLSWFFIGVLYYLIPYTKVKIRSVVIGATSTTVILYLFFYSAIQIQSLIFTRYSLLYGSLAIFPLIMLFLYLSWIIILYGVTLTFAHQHLDL